MLMISDHHQYFTSACPSMWREVDDGVCEAPAGHLRACVGSRARVLDVIELPQKPWVACVMEKVGPDLCASCLVGHQCTGDGPSQGSIRAPNPCFSLIFNDLH